MLYSLGFRVLYGKAILLSIFLIYMNFFRFLKIFWEIRGLDHTHKSDCPCWNTYFQVWLVVYCYTYCSKILLSTKNCKFKTCCLRAIEILIVPYMLCFNVSFNGRSYLVYNPYSNVNIFRSNQNIKDFKSRVLIYPLGALSWVFVVAPPPPPVFPALSSGCSLASFLKFSLDVFAIRLR